MTNKAGYRGRLAPSPTGRLHLGHAFAFLEAERRCKEAGGCLIYRNEDLDRQRSRPEFIKAAIRDLRELQIEWQEGPDIGGPHAPYSQSERISIYEEFLIRLSESGCIYPCSKTRSEIRSLSQKTAPNGESLFPLDLRDTPLRLEKESDSFANLLRSNWRFAVPENREVSFVDGRLGECRFLGQHDFGDFLIWRKDGVPSYEFAVVIDDFLMQITEVVRGEDLLLSTARQLLVFEALGLAPPDYYHCPLIVDSSGRKLSKRDGDGNLHDLLAQQGARGLRRMLAGDKMEMEQMLKTKKTSSFRILSD